MYDVIGDIHGYASILKQLLKKLGYERRNGTFQHSVRKALFVGDYIDRGPEIPETLDLVRSMVDAGSAIALMGNHEFNAIMFNEPDGHGDFLRPHSDKNIEQHAKTLEQFQGANGDYESYIDWFKKLPIYYEVDGFRAIHACWNSEYLDRLNNYTDNRALKSEYIRKAGKKHTALYAIVEELLKGKEVPLPDGITFTDKEDNKRYEVRVKWWLNPKQVTLKEWSLNSVSSLDSESPVNTNYHSEFWYDENQKPVFFGHYWLNGKPALQRANVCCLDYSIGKQDKLVAYRYDGEEELIESKLYWVDYRKSNN